MFEAKSFIFWFRSAIQKRREPDSDPVAFARLTASTKANEPGSASLARSCRERARAAGIFPGASQIPLRGRFRPLDRVESKREPLPAQIGQPGRLRPSRRPRAEISIPPFGRWISRKRSGPPFKNCFKKKSGPPRAGVGFARSIVSRASENRWHLSGREPDSAPGSLSPACVESKREPAPAQIGQPEGVSESWASHINILQISKPFSRIFAQPNKRVSGRVGPLSAKSGPMTVLSTKKLSAGGQAVSGQKAAQGSSLRFELRWPIP